MDGSDVTVVILGEKGVGKTTFIEHCFQDASGSARLSRHAKVVICGREVSIRMVDNPGKSQLVPAMMVIVLLDLTNKNTFDGLSRMLKLAQRVSPVALKAVVGTKADLIEQRKVESQKVVSLIQEFCCEHNEGTQTIPYYETALIPNDSIFVAFQEIIARPLINDYVIKAATDQEQISFAHEVMEWSITHNSANILTHLRKLGYPIPLDIIKRYPTVIRDYLLAEYPLRVIPQFTYVDLPPPNFGLEDSTLLEDFDDEPQSLHDIRPTIEVTRTYHLYWTDISLYCFLSDFISQDVIDVRNLTHIDLSHNCLTSLPTKILKLPRLESLNISHNQLTSLPALESWHPASRLQVLLASHNQIAVSNQTHLVQGRGAESSEGGGGRDREREPFQDLWYIDFSHNQLTSFPMFVFNFRQLHHLDVSHNTQITKLPTQLGRLKNLVTLVLDGLSLFHPPSFIVEEGTAAILDFMRGKINHSSLWSSMRVVIVGSKGTGKTSLVKRVKGESSSLSTATKGLDVSEWKYKGGDLLSFRNKLLTFDVWDFSGDPDYRSIYSCFDCSSSLHLVVCKPSDSPRELVRWLSDIQSCSVHRIPVVIVFTFMDCFKTRDQREEFKKKTLNWISYHNIKGDQLKGISLSMSTMTESMRSLQGGDMFVASHELPHEAFDMQEVTSEDIPIMPLVVKTLFVSNSTGENISNVRRLLYKLASNPSVAPSTHIAPFNLIGQEVPTSYVHVEQLVRQLRLKVQQNPRDGERPAFYTLTQLREVLSKHLHDLNISDTTFFAALKYLHEVGVIYVYQCRGGGPLLVSIDLQMIGSLLQKTLQATCAPHTSSLLCYLANTHLVMIWGVEQVVLIQQQEEGWAKETQYGNRPSSQNLLDYLYHLDICSPLFPGTSLLPSIVPSSLPKGSEPDSASLLPRRVYILNYMPTLFAFQLLSRLVASLVRDSVPSLAVSPSQTAPPPSVPLILPSGIQLYLWKRNVLVVDPADGSKFWVRVREGKVESEGEELPYAGRVDVQLEAGPEREVKWLRLITAEIDHLLKVDYPCLLETQRCVEVCATLALPETSEETSDPSDLELSNGPPPPPLTTVPVSDLTHSTSSSKIASTNCQPPLPTTANQLPDNQNREAETLSPSKQQEYSQSWEVVSRQSTTSTLLSTRLDASSPNQQLVPLWECLQEAFKSPMVRVGSHRVKLQQVIPELLFNDFAPELLFRTTLSAPDMFLMSLEEHMNGGIPPPEDTGRYLRLYYTQENEDHSIMKTAGAEKAFYLQSRLVHLRSDFFRLQQLQSPHLVLPLGVNFSPPCMALESAPHGSLRQLLRNNKGASIGRNIIHHIALQLIAGLEFLHTHKFQYHGINSSNVLIWNLDPIAVKLSDSGITHPSLNCNLCSYLNSMLDASIRRSTSQRIDYILLGLLVFEMATGKAPYEGIYPPSSVVRAILHNKMKLSIEAQHFLQNKLQEESDCERSMATGCQRLCLQSTMEECILRDPVNHRDVKTRFSLCAGDHLWSPMRMLVNVECMLCSEDAELVYWASGSRGLVTGTIAPTTGHLDYNILQEAPPPESGLFADRRCKPVPIAVGRATGLALVQRTKQLWVSTENGQMGSVYVFNLPDMRRHHHIHLQDAALCVQAVNDKTAQSGVEELAYRALVGLANGTIIVFLGVMEGGRVLENPLQGPKLVVVTHQRRPCLSLSLTPTGHIWCSCGDTMEVLDAATMKVIRRLATSEGSLNNGKGQKSGSKGKGDVITLTAMNGRGVWTVGRRSKQLKLWDQITASLKGSFTAVTAYDQESCDITALAVQGGVVWLGTRNGYLLLLDAAVMEEGGDPLLGLQYCGEGKVRCIIPLSPQKGITKSLQVICSVEFPDEVSGALLCWEYLSSSRASGHPYILSRSSSAPVPLPLGQESPCLDLREQSKSFSPTSF